MALVYAPDPGTLPDEQWEVIYLSSRDASSAIPINFITHPGVYLTPACFANGVYDDIPAQTCISNLLALQFRRFVVDLYWDTINRQLSLCPVELPPLAGNASSGLSVDISALSSLTATNTPVASTTPPTGGSPVKRQTEDPSLNTTTPTANVTTSATSTMPASIPTTTGVGGTTLLEIGKYRCSLDLNLDSIISLLSSFFSNTSDTLSVRLAYLDLNLHAAAPFTAPGEPAGNVTGQKLPILEELAGSQLSSAFPRALFTPEQLAEDRRDLGRSWYRNSFSQSTDTSYFEELRGSGHNNFTLDGWPGEAWLLLSDNRRLLASWGQIDPQMQLYNFQEDAASVFPAGYINADTNISVDDTNSIDTGCFYRIDEFEVNQINSSWATATFRESIPDSLSDTIGNLTSCGISSVLNSSLSGTVTQDNLAPYKSFAEATVFGWARGEPRNVSRQGGGGSNNGNRCAIIDSTSGYNGHWRVDNCQSRHRVACRARHQPYVWNISTMSVPFGAAPDVCPDGSTFQLPRTGLENTYLYQRILGESMTSDTNDGNSMLEGVWINFNSLDFPNCWTSGGPNATCPYVDTSSEQRQRNVLIPAIAALIVLLLSVLTLLVKCNENRRNSRTRRRGDNGWDYEGVPS
ncbi:hypothetical protein B0A52_00096 [Exophiala mesophila]|uniref:Maintenance of telomere capping protein 6 n=1 Tax=Exophiala mesophila TaxID=212818 RepID=A0A438NJ34_EXOME|nr:hypothetical protein B0A52_00096 [Exophiala mesophila]